MRQHGLRIRDGSREDGPRLRELWAVCWTATYRSLIGAAGVDGMLRELDGSDCQDMLPGTDERVLVAVRGDEVVGSAIFAERHGIAYLWGMYVHPDCQRQGLGAALLAAIAARVPPTTRVEARVLASSSGARAFYHRFGFVEIETCTSHLGSDDPGRSGIVMSVSSALLHPT